MGEFYLVEDLPSNNNWVDPQDDLMTLRFYEIWTKKESRIKWEGKGLSIPLPSKNVLDHELAYYRFALFAFIIHGTLTDASIAAIIASL